MKQIDVFLGADWCGYWGGIFNYITLSAKQAVLYRKLLAETQERILDSEGMQRRGAVLALLLHLKQICNHPDQYLGTEEYSPSQSDKFEMLRQLAQTIAEKRERELVFTQFRELTGYLDGFLAEVFGRRGGVIHGGVPVKARNEIVDRFQGEVYVPYLVLSVKASGESWITEMNNDELMNLLRLEVKKMTRYWNETNYPQPTEEELKENAKNTCKKAAAKGQTLHPIVITSRQIAKS